MRVPPSLPAAHVPKSGVPDHRTVYLIKSKTIAAGGIHLHPQSGHRYIKWNAFPDHVWDRGVYVRIPREIVFETPSQTVEERIKYSMHAPWSEENVQIMKLALDVGEVKVLNRPSGRNVVFECFDKNGAIVDVGRWSKQELNTHRRIRRLKIKEGKEGISDMGSSMVTDETEEETDELESTTDDDEAHGPQLREITTFLRHLYYNSSLDFSSARAAWRELPRLLARRKLYMTGLPAECAPNVVDDEVDPSSGPASWSNSHCDKFLLAARAGNIKLVRRDSNLLILFQLANSDGSIANTLLQYSPSWIQKNMQASIMNNPTLFQRQRRNPRETENHSRVPVGATVKSSGRGWVVVEESTDEDDDGALADDPKEQRKQLRLRVSAMVQKLIVDFNIRGDGTEVVWNTLPQALANYNKYLTGIPVGGLPKIKDDKVIFQASHPSLWNGAVIGQMQLNIDEGKFKVLDRAPGRIVLFEVDDGDRTYDSTLGYSQDWVALNMPDLSLKQQKREALARVEQKKIKAAAAAANAHSSGKEKEERRKADKAFMAHGASAAATSARLRKSEENARKKEEQERAKANATAFAKHRFAEVSVISRTPNPSYNFDSSRKQSTHSGTSTPHSEPSGSSSHMAHHPMIPTLPQAESNAPAVHPRQAFKGKQRNSNANGSGSYPNLGKARLADDTRRGQDWSFSSVASGASGNHAPWSPAVSSLDPIRTPVMTGATPKSGLWPPPGYPRPQWGESKMEEFQNVLARFFDRHAMGTKAGTIPWRTLPQMLAERRQYLCGVPFICTPVIEDDRVSPSSNLSNWTAEMCGAMNWALSEKFLNIKPREPGRRVLFELIGSDGLFTDSTLGYSDRWVDTFLADTVPNGAAYRRGASPLTPVVSLKRGRDGVHSPVTADDTDAERDIKRRKPNEEDEQELVSPVDTPEIVPPRPKTVRPFRMGFNNSGSSGGSHDTSEEVINPKDLGLDRLIPSSLPPPLRKGRVFLRFSDPSSGKEEEVWEWIPPNDQGPTFSLQNSTIWNSTQAKWRITATSRSLAHLAAWETKEKADWPSKVDGNILGRGRCEFEESRSQWEMHFDNKGSDTPWVVGWNEDFARWEWTLLPTG